MMEPNQKKPDKLTLNCQFRRAYYKGAYKSSPLLVTYVVKAKGKRTRYGITTSKKIGNAVTRNRARRVIAAAAREVIPQLPGGYDIVFVARAATASAKSYQVLVDMRRQLTRLIAEKQPKKSKDPLSPKQKGREE